MAKAPNPPAPPAESKPLPPTSPPPVPPRVTYTTTEGVTTVINAPAATASAPEPTEETE